MMVGKESYRMVVTQLIFKVYLTDSEKHLQNMASLFSLIYGWFTLCARARVLTDTRRFSQICCGNIEFLQQKSPKPKNTQFTKIIMYHVCKKHGTSASEFFALKST